MKRGVPVCKHMFAHSTFKGSPSKEEFHGTHGTPSRSATDLPQKLIATTVAKCVALILNDHQFYQQHACFPTGNVPISLHCVAHKRTTCIIYKHNVFSSFAFTSSNNLLFIPCLTLIFMSFTIFLTHLCHVVGYSCPINIPQL